MKNILLTFINLIIIFSNLIYAQSGWYSLNSDTKINLNKIQFVNSKTGWAGGHQSMPTRYILVKTTDGGDSWTNQIQNFPFGNRITSLFFLDENTGWVTGADGLFKTTNGGDNYFMQNRKTIIDCYFVNSSTGWIIAVANATQLLKTTDGGESFIEQNFNFSSSEAISAIRFVNSETGWCVGNNNIFKTTDCGNIWVLQSHPDCSRINSLFILSSECAWISADNGIVLSTTNGGNDWILKTIEYIFSITSLHFINSYTGYATTYPQNIFKTTNNGLNWYSQMTDTTSYLNYIFFSSNQTGYTCGSQGKILKTTNGGDFFK